MTTPDQKDAYLGDGVYASFDGYQIWLAVNHHENKQVAMEPTVLLSLLAYAERVYGLTITVTKGPRHDNA
jgi:hypothetical protein